jgi:hypothetical protein
MKWRKVTVIFVGSLVVLSMACNGVGNLAGVPVDTEVIQTTTPALPEGSTATASPPPTLTPNPTATPFGPHAVALLDSLPALATTRQRVQAMQVVRMADGEVFSGEDILRWMLIDQRYDPGWTNPQKEQLLGMLDGFEFPTTGQRILVINLAHGLAVEAKGLVPWSLGEYSAMEIENLFIEDTALHILNPALHRGEFPPGMPNLRTHTHPMDDHMVEAAHVKQYHLGQRLIGGATTQSEAVMAILEWMAQNFFHAYGDYSWEVYLDGREPRPSGPAAFPASLERIYEERITGCHEPTVMLEGMLHSLNVPALRLKVHGHGVLYLPSLDRYVHGDHVANYTDAPGEVLLLTPEEFRPYAEEVGMIFQIYFDKYQPPFPSVPLCRDGDELYIFAGRMIEWADMTCVQVSEEDWARLSQQLAAYNIQYNTTTCDLTSDRVPILTLEELSVPWSER